MEVWGRREEFLKYIKHKKNTRNKQTHASPYHQYVVQRELAPVLPLDAAAPHDVRHDGNSLGEVKPGRQGAGGGKGGNEIGNDNVFTLGAGVSFRFSGGLITIMRICKVGLLARALVTVEMELEKKKKNKDFDEVKAPSPILA